MEIKGIIDLTNEVRTHMPIWVTAPLPVISPVGVVSRDGYNFETISAGTHTGTHVDAPYHFDENGKTVDRIDLRMLVSEGYCLRFSPKGTEITASDLKAKWKPEYDGKTILINTGWSSKRGFTKEFLYDFPGLSLDTVDFIVEHNVNVLGIDTLSMDPFAHSNFDVHRALLSKGRIFLEDLTNLESLTEGKKYLIEALPLKLHNASGSMARVIALDVF